MKTYIDKRRDRPSRPYRLRLRIILDKGDDVTVKSLMFETRTQARHTKEAMDLLLSTLPKWFESEAKLLLRNLGTTQRTALSIDGLKRIGITHPVELTRILSALGVVEKAHSGPGKANTYRRLK